MKILEAALFPPGNISGGGIVVMQSVQSMASFADVDIVSSEPVVDSLPANVRFLGCLEHAHFSLRRLAILLLRRRYNGYVASMDAFEKQMDLDSYDLFHIESSSSPIGVDSAVRLGKPMIIRLHNIERDASYNNMKQDGHPLKQLKRFFRFYLPESACEKRILSMRENVLFAFLNERDVQRAMELYHVNRDQCVIIPVCVPERKVDLSEKDPAEPFTVLFTGSFWYHPNKEGLLWFIEHVWVPFRKEMPERNCRLILAGRKPDEELQEMCRRYSVELVDSPADLSPYFQEADLCAAPLLHGTGMKVKVAEALSWGVPVLGTEEALIGYPADNDCIMQSDTAEEFIGALKKLTASRLSPEKKKRALEIWRRYYSPERSTELYRKAVDRLLNRKTF